MLAGGGLEKHLTTSTINLLTASSVNAKRIKGIKQPLPLRLQGISIIVIYFLKIKSIIASRRYVKSFKLSNNH